MSIPDGPGPILRLFDVTVKEGCAEALLAQFSTTSANVVQGQPGNHGFFFGKALAQKEENRLVFASLWTDMAAIRVRFGAEWQVSHMPPGYEDMIERHAISHINLSGGWHIGL